MKQWMINCVLFIICLTALGFSLMKITPFEIELIKNIETIEKMRLKTIVKRMINV